MLSVLCVRDGGGSSKPQQHLRGWSEWETVWCSRMGKEMCELFKDSVKTGEGGLFEHVNHRICKFPILPH